jgi:hypothetical protein
MRIHSLGCAAILATILTGCMDVPPLEMATGGIAVGDVVDRVKCELAFAFSERIGEEKFRWMETWTVKADLTLQAKSLGRPLALGWLYQSFSQRL